MVVQKKEVKSTPVQELTKFLEDKGYVINLTLHHETGDDGRILCKPQIQVLLKQS